MTQSCLNYLSLMSIESDPLKTIDFDELIADFAAKKSRKKVKKKKKIMYIISLFYKKN